MTLVHISTVPLQQISELRHGGHFCVAVAHSTGLICLHHLLMMVASPLVTGNRLTVSASASWISCNRICRKLWDCGTPTEYGHPGELVVHQVFRMNYTTIHRHLLWTVWCVTFQTCQLTFCDMCEYRRQFLMRIFGVTSSTCVTFMDGKVEMLMKQLYCTNNYSTYCNVVVAITWHWLEGQLWPLLQQIYLFNGEYEIIPWQ